ncbi:response regulator transcription factor [Bythopirellula polymerisocia]|uniref:Bacterial regulatory protein, luxR family n=1 Tax=Bythopirellula polymerisocia TaxID=2528003 RepID=A0A5C6D2E2_9BACT|nr:helix-turn-helix transcriptional regulator [Bythopirellula polymerisocia]TWU29951.1 Bacterial regulatory protein, luxR family [Bythopirellula polymerisocia]
MARSERLRLSEIRAISRLIGECRELGPDPIAWRRHYLQALRKIVGAPVIVGGTWRMVSADGPPQLHDNLELGFASEHQHLMWRSFMTEGMISAASFRSFASRPGKLITCTRQEVATDREWYHSPEYQNYMRLAGVDASLASFYRPQPWNIASAVTIHRPIGEQQFGERERKLLEFTQGEIGRLVGKALAGPDEPQEALLPRRVQQTLHCLLEGDSERQVASRLGISPETVHQYVKQIYRHYMVSSRAELLARWLRFHRGLHGDGSSLSDE